jgi:eukaryotic-like serine/threonine-protein kinase
MRVAGPGDLLAGRYRLRTVIGGGAMGVVWLAGDQMLRRDVAVKEVTWPARLDAAEQESLRRRALRKARTAARLNHPNIVRVYDVVEEGGRPWVVMQFVPYRSLSEVVRDDGPLPPGQAARAGLQVLSAIRAAHAAGVLHGDVKPASVLLGPDGQVVLAGFGTAIADGDPALTASGILVGSAPYLAPERAGGQPATAAADLWSLGTTLYEAVEGRPPFSRDGTMAVLSAVVGDDPDPPARAGTLWPVIRRLLRKDPKARLGAAETEHLLRIVAGEHGDRPPVPVEAPTAPPGRTGPAAASSASTRPDIPPPAVTVPAQPRRQAAAAGGAQAGPVLIRGPKPLAPGPAGKSPPPRPGPPSTAPGGRHRRRRWVLAVLGCAAAAAGIVTATSLASGPAPGHRAATPATPKASHARPAPPPSTSAPAPPSRSPATPGGTGRSSVLPTGFTRYHDPTGFSIGVPAGWPVSHQGHLVYIRDPHGGRFLLIDQTTHPQPDPLADWRRQEAARISTYPGYHRIRLQAVHYPQAERAADWEFTYYQGGTRIHVLNRNVLASAHHAYALYWSTPASQWAASFHLFRAFAATFRPARPRPGS